MLEWNLFGGACLFAAHFATLQNVDAMQESVLPLFTSISVGALIIVCVHLGYHINLTVPGIVRRLGRDLYTCTSFLTEVSMFLVLCQNIGKRGPQQYTIPVEYAYLPFLVTVLLYSSQINFSTIWVQCSQGVAFLLILFYPVTYNMSYPGDISHVVPVFVLLVFIHAVPVSDVSSDLHHTLVSIFGKILALALGIGMMHSVPRPDPSTFNRLHDFYLLRAVSHFDPQFIESDVTPFEHLFSFHGLAGHVVKVRTV
jgi:hypothetical protein